jgi:hypothetical protein
MGQSYKQCTECGARALSIATRCPRCHREFPAPVEEPAVTPVRRLGRMRLRTPGIAAGLLGLGAVLTVTELGQTTGSRTEPTSMAAAESSAAMSEVGFVHSEAGRASVSVAQPPARNAGELRVAKSWTHVRKARSRSADLEAVLTPGDTVFADSLDRGWYRVALDGEVLGYANESMLTPTEPARP